MFQNQQENNNCINYKNWEFPINCNVAMIVQGIIIHPNYPMVPISFKIGKKEDRSTILCNLMGSSSVETHSFKTDKVEYITVPGSGLENPVANHIIDGVDGSELGVEKKETKTYGPVLIIPTEDKRIPKQITDKIKNLHRSFFNKRKRAKPSGDKPSGDKPSGRTKKKQKTSE